MSRGRILQAGITVMAVVIMLVEQPDFPLFGKKLGKLAERYGQR